MAILTVAICTYNRADQLRRLVMALREIECPTTFDILVVDNNSKDNTQAVLAALAHEPGASLRHVREDRQGIVHARNRAIEESLDSKFLLFLDDDELPFPTQLQATLHALDTEQADCAGGKYVLKFLQPQPRWLVPYMHPMLGQLDHGEQAFWINTPHTPLWTGNMSFRTSLFKQHPDLRFDIKFNRFGDNAGGGEDMVIFHELLAMGKRVRYRPDMAILHLIPPQRMTKRYFMKLAWHGGMRFGRRSAFPESVGQIAYSHYALLAIQTALRALVKSITFRPDAFAEQLKLLRFCAVTVSLLSKLFSMAPGQRGVAQ